MKQTPPPQDWHDVGRLLGKKPIKLPKPITTPVRSCDSLMAAIQRDRDAGLLPSATQGQTSFMEVGTQEERPEVSGIVHAVEGNANG